MLNKAVNQAETQNSEVTFSSDTNNRCQGNAYVHHALPHITTDKMA